MISQKRLNCLLATRALYPKGFSFMHLERPATLARQVIKDVSSDPVLCKTADVSVIERSLRSLMNWQITQATYPREQILNIPADEMDDVIAGETPYLAKFNEARPRILDFLGAALKGCEDDKLAALWKKVPAFYSTKPASNIFIGNAGGGTGPAAMFRNVPPSDVSVFVPRSDNLSDFSFEVFDKQAKRLCGYAFAEGAEGFFEDYNYTDEEYKRFMLFNAHLFQRGNGFFDTLREIAMKEVLHRAGLGKRPRNPGMKTYIIGPARSIDLKLPRGRTLIFSRLNLENGVRYNLAVKRSQSLLAQAKTLLMEIINADDENDIRPLYLTIHNNKIGFFPVYAREVDEKGRICVPEHLQQRPWDDLPNRLKF